MLEWQDYVKHYRLLLAVSFSSITMSLNCQSYNFNFVVIAVRVMVVNLGLTTIAFFIRFIVPDDAQVKAPELLLDVRESFVLIDWVFVH